MVYEEFKGSLLNIHFKYCSWVFIFGPPRYNLILLKVALNLINPNLFEGIGHDSTK